MKIPYINQETFLKVGASVFFLAGFMGIGTFIATYNSLIIYQKISSIAMIFFNFFLALFFYSLLRMARGDLNVEMEEVDLNKLEEELKND